MHAGYICTSPMSFLILAKAPDNPSLPEISLFFSLPCA